MSLKSSFYWVMAAVASLVLGLSNCAIMTGYQRPQASVTQSYPELMFMLPINVDQHSCLGSILSPAEQRCTSWTQREIAGPLYLKARHEVIIGGRSGFLQAIDIHARTTNRLKKLAGNLIARPLEFEGKLLFGLDSGVIQSVNTDTFRENWQAKVDGGVGAPLARHGNRLIVVTDISSVYAFNVNSGELLWVLRRPFEKGISLPYLSAPLIQEMKIGSTQGTYIVCGHPSGRLDFIDINSGVIEHDLMIGKPRQPFSDVVAGPLWFKDTIIAAGFNNGIVAFDPISKTVIWTVEEKEITRLAIADGQIIAAGPKKIIGLNGKNRLWSFVFDRGEPTSLVINNGLIYFGADENGFFVLDRYSGIPLKYAGSRIGFAGDLEWSEEDGLLFATSTSGYLYVMNSHFNGTVQKRLEH